MPALRPCLALLLTALLVACAAPAPVAPAAIEVAALPAAIEPDPAIDSAADSASPAVVAASAEPEADPLAGADALATLACQSEGVLVAGQAPADLLYQCAGLSTGVTLAALRAAGWQLDRLGIGARAEHAGELGLPLSLTLRRRP